MDGGYNVIKLEACAGVAREALDRDSPSSEPPSFRKLLVLKELQ
jgi:hypothetical protein